MAARFVRARCVLSDMALRAHLEEQPHCARGNYYNDLEKATLILPKSVKATR
jgi:hypothetical protein